MAHNLYKIADDLVTILGAEFPTFTVARAGAQLHHVDQVYSDLPAIWVSPGDMDRDGEPRSQNFMLDQIWNVTLVLSAAEPVPGMDAGAVLYQIITRLDGLRTETGTHVGILKFSGVSAPEHDRGAVQYPAAFTTRLPVINKRT